MDYKWETDKYISYFFIVVYLVYMSSIMYFVDPKIVCGWFIFYFCINIMRFGWSPSKTPVSDWTKSFWNWLEAARLLFMIDYVINILKRVEDADYPDRFERTQEDRNKMAYIVLLSMFGTLGYLRIYKKYRILLEFIRVSFIAVGPFLLITGIMLVAFAFAFSYYYHASVNFTEFKQHFSD